MKIKCKKFLLIPRWPVGVKSNYVVLRGVSWLHNHLPYMPAQSRQSERQHIIHRTHTWQQCLVARSEDIPTTKYGFNLRYISPLSIDNNTNTLAGDWRQSSVSHMHNSVRAITKLALWWSDIRWFPTIRIRYTPLHEIKGPGKQFKRYSANLSTRRPQSGGIPACGVTLCLTLTALK